MEKLEKMIDSSFIKIDGKQGLPWNERLIDDESKNSLKEFNEITKDYTGKLRVAIERGEIELQERTVCNCGAAELELVSSFDRFGLDFGSYICRKCGLVMTSPFIADESLEDYYNTYYHPLVFGRESLSDLESLFLPGQGKKIYEKVRAFVGVRKELKVLEIGVGTGSVLAEFKEAAGEEGVVIEELGTEYSDECIRKAEENGVNVIFGAFDEVIAKKTKFDLVILSHVFEHFIDLTATLKKLKEVLADDAMVYVEVPGLMTLYKKHIYGFDFLQYTIHAHIHNFNLTSLTRIFNENGFELIMGNEEVEALFRPGGQTVDSSKNYDTLKSCLSLLELGREDLIELHNGGMKVMKALIERKDQWIKNRDEQLEKKDQMLKYSNNQLAEKVKQQSELILQVEEKGSRIRGLILSLRKRKNN